MYKNDYQELERNKMKENIFVNKFCLNNNNFAQIFL